MGKASKALVGVLAIAALGLGPGPASAEVEWLCEPGMEDNPCEIPLDTTYQGSEGADRVATPPVGPRRFDCFYVYPTVSNQPTATASKSRDPELESIAKFQAARFSQRCRVFAPIYRQSTLTSLTLSQVTGSRGGRELAFRDVLEAWHEYLDRHNRGRGVVLVGHSQGTFVLRQLISREIEDRPRQRRKVISAVLLGGNVTVAEGSLVGGDFDRMQLCAWRGQIGCVVAFSTFAEDPDEDARFGVTEPGMEVACTDPRKLAGTRKPLRVLTPSEPFALGPIAAGIIVTSGGLPPSARTTWVSPPDRFDAACRRINGAHVLRIEPLPGSRRPMWFPEPSWGTHLIDVNVALAPLGKLISAQSRRWARRR